MGYVSPNIHRASVGKGCFFHTWKKRDLLNSPITVKQREVRLTFFDQAMRSSGQICKAAFLPTRHSGSMNRRCSRRQLFLELWDVQINSNLAAPRVLMCPLPLPCSHRSAVTVACQNKCLIHKKQFFFLEQCLVRLCGLCRGVMLPCGMCISKQDHGKMRMEVPFLFVFYLWYSSCVQNLSDF